jgi:hypothetical protein
MEGRRIFPPLSLLYWIEKELRTEKYSFLLKATCEEGKMSYSEKTTNLDSLANISGAYFLTPKHGVSFSALVSAIEDLTATAKSKIAMIRSKGSAMSISDMFDLQMAMNRLSQLSEMSTSVISAMNSTITSMAKNVAR